MCDWALPETPSGRITRAIPSSVVALIMVEVSNEQDADAVWILRAAIVRAMFGHGLPAAFLHTATRTCFIEGPGP